MRQRRRRSKAEVRKVTPERFYLVTRARDVDYCHRHNFSNLSLGRTLVPGLRWLRHQFPPGSSRDFRRLDAPSLGSPAMGLDASASVVPHRSQFWPHGGIRDITRYGGRMG
jgi:hypothetical protein